MGQLIYCFVARETVVLAEFTSFKGNFNTIALQCLEKMPRENNKFTFPHGSHTLNYLLDNGYGKQASPVVSLVEAGSTCDLRLPLAGNLSIILMLMLPSTRTLSLCSLHGARRPGRHQADCVRVPGSGEGGLHEEIWKQGVYACSTLPRQGIRVRKSPEAPVSAGSPGRTT